MARGEEDLLQLIIHPNSKFKYRLVKIHTVYIIYFEAEISVLK